MIDFIIPYSPNTNSLNSQPKAAYYYESSTSNEMSYINLSSSSNRVIFINQSRFDNLTSEVKNYSSDLSMLYKKLNWAEEFFKNSLSLNNPQLLLPYYKEIDKLLKNKEFHIFNTFVRNINTKRLSDVLLIGLVRLTYTKRTQLPDWNLLLSNVSNELSTRGYDEKKVLRGLI